MVLGRWDGRVMAAKVAAATIPAAATAGRGAGQATRRAEGVVAPGHHVLERCCGEAVRAENGAGKQHLRRRQGLRERGTGGQGPPGRSSSSCCLCA
jgi:hypothetical protein